MYILNGMNHTPRRYGSIPEPQEVISVHNQLIFHTTVILGAIIVMGYTRVEGGGGNT